MVYPENIEVKIGFDKIRILLKQNCLSELGKSHVDEISFRSNFKEIEKKLLQVKEFKDILLMENQFPSNNYFDMREVVLRLKTSGSTIGIEELYNLFLSLQTCKDIQSFFGGERKDKYPNIYELVSYIYFRKEIIIEANRIIDEKGRVKDSASEELSNIRHQLQRLYGSSRNKIYDILRSAKKQGWARDDAEVTLRNGRVVIPLLANFKRSVKGFIHDESGSGQTSFVEPIELFETNNKIKELETEEINEIKRILLRFCDFIRNDVEALSDAFYFLGLVDFIRAKAKFAQKTGAIVPLLSDRKLINWLAAENPILAMSHKLKGKIVVPLDIKLDAEGRILIVSGPNAGGKSVLLKTVALNQYMLQCAIPVLMREISETGIFQNILIDIGDEQSIENDLSTYSSHLRNIKYFVDNANENSLILIDEFGTGTEPELGGAIASASLLELYKRGVYAIVTTHYAQLKLLADSNENIVNGAMMFDTENLSPLFKFKAGKPGSSFAFEIAKNIGLSDEILKIASEFIGDKKLNFDFQLQELENEKDLISRKLAEFNNADRILEETINKYNSLYQDVKQKEKQIIFEAKRQAKEIIAGSNRAIENAISAIKKSGADKEVSKIVRQDLEDVKVKLDRDIENSEKRIIKTAKKEKVAKKVEGINILEGAINVGDTVIIENQNTPGVVESISRKNAVVNFNSVKIVISVEKLCRIKPPKVNKINNSSNYGNILKEIHHRVADFSANIDIRGLRVEEALNIIKNWIDEAMLTGHKDLEVLHGKGDGILRKLLREYLSKQKQIENYCDAPIELGGSGKTFIKLK
ncbi:MAG: hypothetical protein AUJ98_08870 [Bacteroidetes bacterium CG2_30_33_31]|nr:MAG: hypothetical protein AUJ98_08870 [Bacteroidetes bacterium CG2_30_33_31]